MYIYFRFETSAALVKHLEFGEEMNDISDETALRNSFSRFSSVATNKDDCVKALSNCVSFAKFAERERADFLMLLEAIEPAEVGSASSRFLYARDLTLLVCLSPTGRTACPTSWHGVDGKESQRL